MKTTRLLRTISLLGFLLLMAPFYDACGGGMKQKEANTAATADPTAVKVDSVAIGTTKINKIQTGTVANSVEVEKFPFYKKVFDVVVDKDSFNGFELAWVNIDHTFKETKDEIIKVYQDKKWYSELLIYVCFIFDFIVLISFSMFVLSFTNKLKVLNKLALVNSVLIVITLLYIILLEESFEDFRQIKWGYYSFIITNILILYFTNKEFRRKKS